MYKLKHKHVVDAITRIDNGETGSFHDSTKYDLLLHGKRYPPKTVYGLSAKSVIGRNLSTREFSGGETSTCFRVLRNLGFQIVKKSRRS
jgi:hypothetical protein